MDAPEYHCQKENSSSENNSELRKRLAPGKNNEPSAVFEYFRRKHVWLERNVKKNSPHYRILKTALRWLERGRPLIIEALARHRDVKCHPITVRKYLNSASFLEKIKVSKGRVGHRYRVIGLPDFPKQKSIPKTADSAPVEAIVETKPGAETPFFAPKQPSTQPSILPRRNIYPLLQSSIAQTKPACLHRETDAHKLLASWRVIPGQVLGHDLTLSVCKAVIGFAQARDASISVPELAQAGTALLKSRRIAQADNTPGFFVAQTYFDIERQRRQRAFKHDKTQEVHRRYEEKKRFIEYQKQQPLPPLEPLEIERFRTKTG